MNLIEKYRAKVNDAGRQMNDQGGFLSRLSEEERFMFEERAAIMEYDGGLTRAEAERAARTFLQEGKGDKEVPDSVTISLKTREERGK